MKLYFETKDSELAYPLQYFDEIRERPFELFEAVPCKVEGFFFCKSVGECTEEGACGRLCDDYEPCNGISGKCRHKGRLYEKGAILRFDSKPADPVRIAPVYGGRQLSAFCGYI